MMLFVVLLQHFICVKAIQISKSDLISKKYQVMVVGMLKNWSRKYSSHYIIKFIGFIYRFIMLLSWILFHSVYLYFGSINLLQV